MTTDWNRLEEALASDTVRGRRGAAVERELGEFDETELRVLRRLATRASLSRSRTEPRGNVVFLHGITGSDLETIAGGDRSRIWTNFIRLIRGRIEWLKLAPDGDREADSKFRVEATQPNKRYYARAILSLRAHWNAKPFAYDWRRDIDTASDALATFIRESFPGEPVHIVAHSMGGLVARNMIRRHPQLWTSMQDGDRSRGGRLIMLGTPNYGSFAIVQALTGEDRMMGVLEKCDLAHDMRELLAITNTFLGSYQLLPAPQKLPAPLASLYQADTWPSFAGVSQNHLNRAYAFHTDLDAATASIDGDRMIYVAGCRRPTIVGMTVAGRGDFEYRLSYEGDGRVPHELGRLPGVPNYYVDEVHGDLARNEQVLMALDQLLESGTSNLATSPLPHAVRGQPSMRDYQSATERLLLDEVDHIAAEARKRGDPEALDEDMLRRGEDALIRAALGSGPRSRPDFIPTESPDPFKEVEKPSLRVSLAFGDICDVKLPIVTVGHYKGVAPINAIGAIDRRLDGWVSLAVKRGLIGGDLGETFFIPGNGKIGAGSVLVAGMGTPGTFSEDRLRVLMSNVAVAASALDITHIATLLIGGGEGNLEPDRILRALFAGLGAGLSTLAEEHKDTAPTLEHVTIVENDGDRFLALIGELDEVPGDPHFPVELDIQRADAADVRAARQQAQRGQRRKGRETGRGRGRGRREQGTVVGDLDDVRITLESEDAAEGRFRFSAITHHAVVPVRDVASLPSRFANLGRALRKSELHGDQKQYGRLLFDYIVPEDFDEVIGDASSLRFIVDRTTASFPWEMACYQSRSGKGGLRTLGIDMQLTRQFRTLLSRPPGPTPPLNDQLRVLVIADPAPEPELQLPYARREGRSVVEALRQLDGSGLRIDVESRIGASECDFVEILAQILTGGFDIVHFAGHGDYDPNDPKSVGWVFNRETMLTANDIFRARRVPRLVFANACFSGVIHQGPSYEPPELTRELATIAQAFFERGVPNYIGSGWPVNDAQAGKFAVTFYEQLLSGGTLRQAIHAARTRIHKEGFGSTWGAYQHYGNPNDTLVRRAGSDGGRSRAAPAEGTAGRQTGRKKKAQGKKKTQSKNKAQGKKTAAKKAKKKAAKKVTKKTAKKTGKKTTKKAKRTSRRA